MPKPPSGKRCPVSADGVTQASVKIVQRLLIDRYAMGVDRNRPGLAAGSFRKLYSSPTDFAEVKPSLRRDRSIRGRAGLDACPCSERDARWFFRHNHSDGQPSHMAALETPATTAPSIPCRLGRQRLDSCV